MYTLLKENANYLGKKAAEFTSELVRTPSLSLCENNVARMVEKKMDELGYDKVFVDDFGNVIGIIYGIESAPTVLLNSHMDTVSPDGENQVWEIPPYSGETRNGKLYGLGSSDCKSGLAMQIYAGYLLKRALLPLRGTLIVAATVSEENGLSLGVQHLISKTLADMKIKVDYAILGEPTGLGLFYGHDGWAEFRIGMDSPNPNFLHDAANAVFQNLLNASEVKGLPGYIELMNVERPEFNRYSGDAYISFSRRLYHDDNAEELKEKIKESGLQNVSREPGLNMKVMIREEAQKLQSGQTIQVRYLSSAWETDPFSPLMDRSRQALSSAGCKTQPGKWLLPRLGMGTAGSILTKRFNIPTIGYGPGTEEVAHSVKECVELDKITEGLLGTASIVHSLAGIPVFGWTSDMDI
jgi:acetylornithine deacetylase/succinyl-diaminopimelate desuccinylase-like protein